MIHHDPSRYAPLPVYAGASGNTPALPDMSLDDAVCLVRREGGLPHWCGAAAPFEAVLSGVPRAIPDLWWEVFITRLVSGYTAAGTVPPFIGGSVSVALPGEMTQARCVYLHRGGEWEGLLIQATVNDRPVEHILIANRMAHAQGQTWALEPDLHGYRQGQVVRFARRGPVWAPAEVAGGTA